MLSLLVLRGKESENKKQSKTTSECRGDFMKLKTDMQLYSFQLPPSTNSNNFFRSCHRYRSYCSVHYWNNLYLCLGNSPMFIFPET